MSVYTGSVGYIAYPSFGVGPFVNVEPACLHRASKPTLRIYANFNDSPNQVARQTTTEDGGIPRGVARVLRRGGEPELLHDDGLVLGGHDGGVVVDPLAAPCSVVRFLTPSVLYIWDSLIGYL